jgi:hypothetical protein
MTYAWGEASVIGTDGGPSLRLPLEKERAVSRRRFVPTWPADGGMTGSRPAARPVGRMKERGEFSTWSSSARMAR